VVRYQRILSLAFVTALIICCAAVSLRAQPQATAKTLAERLGYPAGSRLLIIHADDFGMMHSVDSAISEALENHWVTSASILVPCPWFPEVAQWSKTHPDADLGIHLALNSEWTTYRWPPVSPQPLNSSLLGPDGYLPLETDYVSKHAKMADVETELHAQVDKAKAAGIRLSHLDTHMGALLGTDDLFRTYVATGRAYQLPILFSRQFGPKYAQLASGAVTLDAVLEIEPGVAKTDWLAAYKKMLQPLPPGAYELIVHLAHHDSDIQAATADHPNWGAEWRQNDFDMVRSAEFRQFLRDQGFLLVSWTDLAKASN
jgi:chitin disaccharide deacetylase